MGYVLPLVFLIPTFFIVPSPSFSCSRLFFPRYFVFRASVSFFDTTLPLGSLICHSLPFSSPSTHLQFFISRSNAFSFPDICASLSRYSLFYSSRFLVSSSLPRRSYIRFCSPIDHTFTIAPLVHSLCSLFHLLSSKICYRE